MPGITLTPRIVEGTDGILLAPVSEEGPWAALRALHAGMAALREDGGHPRMAFLLALAEDGRIVPGRDTDAVVFVLGYQLLGL